MPARRIRVMKETNTAKARAPTAFGWENPSTTARATQSFADPSVSPAARTTTPIRRVRGSRQTAKVEGLSWCSCTSGGSWMNHRTVRTTATSASAITTGMCTSRGTPSRAVPAPRSAPSTVPTENPAWKRGMIARPTARSTTVPSTFIATSHPAIPAEVPKRATATHTG